MLKSNYNFRRTSIEFLNKLEHFIQVTIAIVLLNKLFNKKPLKISKKVI